MNKSLMKGLHRYKYKKQWSSNEPWQSANVNLASEQDLNH
jgi:hypothetical protein